MPKHCPTCSKSSNEIKFYGDFCYDCAGKELRSRLPTTIEIERCKRCGRIKMRDSYSDFEGRALEAIIVRKLSKYTVHLLKYDEERAIVEVAEESEKGILAIDHELLLAYKKILCDRDFKKASNYHEAVIQLRGNTGSVERTLERIRRYVERNGEFIARVDPVSNGVNIQISSKKVASEFMVHAKMHPVTSFTLMGVKNGKRVYKNTYALHF
ncbi:MAG: hypothetical protein KGH72_00155 [Candidatus Micrarchaeota archaeon]|nr:hypothetical protein [Candidatus Micrarchaeota archaeon]